MKEFNGTSDELIAAYPILTRADAIQLIAEHGWKPEDSTTTDDDHGTSFDGSLGMHETYRTQAVFDWLGY